MRRLVIAAAILFLPVMTHALDEGVKAPAFSLPQLNDSQIRVSSDDLAGKVVYLDFWASWCAPCRISVPEINALQAKLGSDQFEVIAINLDEDPAAAKKFSKRFPMAYKVLSDPEGTVAENYQLPGMPTSFVVDQSGNISLIHIGFKPGDMAIIQMHIETLLNDAEPS